MDERQFKELMVKMDLIIRLNALDIVRDLKNQKEKILYLSSIGFGPTDIAKLLNTTANTVSVTLSEVKKKTPIVSPDSREQTSEKPSP